MQKFLINPELINEDTAEILGQDARHILRVLRLSPGNVLDLTDGQGTDYRGTIRDTGKDRVTIRLDEKSASRTESPLHLTVCSGMLKHQKMDDVIKTLTQIGIREWIPFFCERAVPTPDAKRLTKRSDRWRIIARESLKQCRRSRLVDIRSPLSFREILELAPDYDHRIAFWEEGGRPLSRLSASKGRNRAIILIGPEGGFSKEEIDRAAQAGFHTYSLGPRILRAETAAVAAAALVQHRLGDI